MEKPQGPPASRLVETLNSCEPLAPASRATPQPPPNPASNTEVQTLATLVVLASPFYREKPNVNAEAVTAEDREFAFGAARWEIANHHKSHPDKPTLSLAEALTLLRDLVERHAKGSPDEFASYRSKLRFYFTKDRPYHNRPQKKLSIVKPPMKSLNERRREELAMEQAQ